MKNIQFLINNIENIMIKKIKLNIFNLIINKFILFILKVNNIII